MCLCVIKSMAYHRGVLLETHSQEIPKSNNKWYFRRCLTDKCLEKSVFVALSNSNGLLCQQGDYVGSGLVY